MITIGGLQFPASVLMLGLVTGMTYGVLAVGLVLVYRISRIINFAHGQIGAFAAAAFGALVLQAHLYYWLALPFALALGAGTGALTEVAVVRRLRNAPRLMSVIATLGAAQFLVAFALVINNQANAGALFPMPPGLPTFRVQALLVTEAYSGMLLLTPVVVIAITLFLRYSRLGMALRAAAANPPAARLAAIRSSRMSAIAWAIAGAVSAFTAILVFPTQGYIQSDIFGPALMLRALAAGVVARMNNLPVALVAGIGVGEIEQVLYWNFRSGGEVEFVLFVIILLGLVVQPAVSGRGEGKDVWATVQGWRPIPEPWLQIWSVRNLGRLTAGLGLALAILLPFVAGFGTTFAFTTIFAFTIAGLSIGIISGLAGQLSLGQFALAGIGSWAAYLVAHATGNFVLAMAAGGGAAALVSIAIGVPALRIRGLMLAVTTLSFALMTQAWLLQQPWALGNGVVPGRPLFWSWQLTNAKSYYWFALGTLVIAFWVAANVRRGGLGRIFVALRDNEDAARAFTINPTARKLQAFALSGFLAGLAGGVFAFALARISYLSFAPGLSIDVVAMSVIGGIGVLAGPLIGALYIFGLPDLLGDKVDAVITAASAAGWLLLILYFPGGLAALIAPVRERVIRELVRLAGRDPDALAAGESVAPTRTEAVLPGHLGSESPNGAEPARSDEPVALLRVEGLRKQFGGVRAVEEVSLEVRRASTVGLIGPNGAGKTTLFELIAGFVRPDSGTVWFDGETLSRPLVFNGRLRVQLNRSAQHRAHRGLVRSFQDAALFPTMTVLEVLMLAHERLLPTTLIGAVSGSYEKERTKREKAVSLIESTGLSPYMHKQVQELSTGTRRILEIACLIALEPHLMLLDEPSSGIAQRETEALGELLVSVQRRLGCTLMVIEHDIPLVMSISDRVIAMESGRIICDGTPEEVRSDALVIESYLGGDVTAITRSGAGVA